MGRRLLRTEIMQPRVFYSPEWMSSALYVMPMMDSELAASIMMCRTLFNSLTLPMLPPEERSLLGQVLTAITDLPVTYLPVHVDRLTVL